MRQPILSSGGPLAGPRTGGEPMKPVRFVVATLATAVCTAWGIAAFACDKHQGTQASAASASGTCNAKMAAACKAKSAAGVSAQAGGCSNPGSAAAQRRDVRVYGQ